MDNKSTLDRLDTIIGLLKRHLPIIETKLDIIRDPNMEDFENVGKLSFNRVCLCALFIYYKMDYPHRLITKNGYFTGFLENGYFIDFFKH